MGVANTDVLKRNCDAAQSRVWLFDGAGAAHLRAGVHL